MMPPMRSTTNIEKGMTLKKRDCRGGLLVELGDGDVGRQRNWVARNVEDGT